MTLAPGEFIRRFQPYVLHLGFHRIRNYWLIANTRRRENLARARELLSKGTGKSTDVVSISADSPNSSKCLPTSICPECGAAMIIIETFVRGQLSRAPPISIDGSS